MILVNDALKRRGVSTWFDGDMLEGDIAQQMAAGIQGSACVLCAITNRYIAKVGGTNANDNCKLEFNYSSNTKSASRMIAVPMEPHLLDPKQWSGTVGLHLGSHLYFADLAFDIHAEPARFEAAVDKIAERVRVICSRL